VLSGLALEPFGDILARQLASLPDGEEMQEAVAACDWAVLSERLGISCAYIDDASLRPSGAAMFESLATRAAPARFYVFQGTQDWHTPVEPVRALEAWNNAQGHLDITFHYYEGVHTGTAEARDELAQLLTKLVSE